MSHVIVSKKSPWVKVSKPFDSVKQAEEARDTILKDPTGRRFEVRDENDIPSPPKPKEMPVEPLESWELLDSRGKLIKTFQAGKTAAGFIQKKLIQFGSGRKVVPHKEAVVVPKPIKAKKKN